MRYCRKCLNVDTRPNTAFSEDGLCPPCQFQQKSSEIIWQERLEQLKPILKNARQNNHSGYDCIVGVSGGKDSTRQALHIRDCFGLKPLLVSMNYPPKQISQNGVRNLSNLIEHGFDCINISCGPQTWMKAMRYSFLNYATWTKPTEYALFASVPRIAIAYQIPLIWWGENAALALGDMDVLGSSPWDGNHLKYSNTLGGGCIDWLHKAGFTSSELIQYIYPNDECIMKANLQIVFMDYFMKDFSSYTNGNFSCLRGLSVREPNPSVDPDIFGTSLLDEDYTNINMYIRYLKYGFGRTSDICNLEIRAGRMTREQAATLVSLYDGNYSEEILDDFCEFICISKEQFWLTVDRFVNRDLFDSPSLGSYIPRFTPGISL